MISPNRTRQLVPKHNASQVSSIDFLLVAQYSLVGIQDTEGVDEWEVARDQLKLGVRDEAILVMVIVFKHSLKNKTFQKLKLLLSLQNDSSPYFVK